MEFPVFRSQVESLPNASPMVDNIRYVLAKKKIDELFVKWLSLPQTQGTIQKLIEEVKKNPQAIINTNLSPYLSSQKANLSTIVGPMSLNNTMKVTPQTPPKSPNDFNKWKALSGTNESGDSSFENSPRNHEDRFSPSLITKNDKERIDAPNEIISKKSKESVRAEELISKKDQEHVNKAVKTDSLTSLDRPEEKKDITAHIRKTSESIPRFFFPNKNVSDTAISEEVIKQINEIYSANKSEDLNVIQFEPVTVQIYGISKFLNPLVFARADKDKRGKVSKNEFLKIWKNEYANLSPDMRCFNVLRKSSSAYITADDLKPIMNIIMEVHPGLEFLKATPEFQDRYSDTVVQRILYGVDKNDDGKISKREFKQSNLFQAFKHLDIEEDINKIRAYFSYEHFYVLYCKFWELDADHDFIISKEEFSRYSGHALSKKTVDRIFDEVPRPFKSKVKGKMSYEDFIWFALSEEDKTTDRSIEYWFKVIDLDQNDLITGYEMEYFYEEQKQRLEYLNHEPVYFEDIICQLVDMFHPEKDIIFKRDHLKQQRHNAGVFFNAMTNLNKFVAYEQRDPFMIRNEMNENPDFSEWDRFAQYEYVRLALEEENADNSGMLDSADLWDADEGENNRS